MISIIQRTDSYKVGHHGQYPDSTEYVYSYFEARRGAKYNPTVFFGLQYYLKAYLEGQVVTASDIDEAEHMFGIHFGNKELFNRDGWEYIVREHNGRLPIHIKAVPEGTPVPNNNVLMTIENTDPRCWWLTNYLETMLCQIWYPCTVATISREGKKILKEHLGWTSDTPEVIDYMLHDFGYRGASSQESAGIGGMAHLINFKGTDTVLALRYAQKYYDANLTSLGFSVPATEHSVMTAHGTQEAVTLNHLLNTHPTGTLSCVSDSYDIYKFVEELICREFKDRIKARDGVFIVRPDSKTDKHKTIGDQIIWILEQLWHAYNGVINSKSYRVLDPHVRVLWGDGIDLLDMQEILYAMDNSVFSAENIVFGMGGGLLQKCNRDTQRFAFKASEITINGISRAIQKNPLDQSKASKKGRLALINVPSSGLKTFQLRSTRQNVVDSYGFEEHNRLLTVFENGEILKTYSFDEVRINAQL